MEDLEERTSVKQVAIKWGLILGILSICLFMIIDFTGMIADDSLKYIGVLPTIVIIFLAHKELKDSGDGFMSYSEGLGLGTLLSVISAVVSGIFTYVYIKFISEDYLEQVKNASIAEMENRGMPEEQIDSSLEMMSFVFTAEFMLIMGVIAGVFMGFIISLIISAITKKQDPSLEI